MPCEAVLATIEVKSQLTKEHAFNAFSAVQAWRRLDRAAFVMMQSDKMGERIVNYIFAFKGPTAQTLHSYMKEFAERNAVPFSDLFDVCMVIAHSLVVLGYGAENVAAEDRYRPERVHHNRWPQKDE